jgi:hypothetical protein
MNYGTSCQGVKRFAPFLAIESDVTGSGSFIAILAQWCTSIPQFNPNLMCKKLDLTDTVKGDLDFFLKCCFYVFLSPCRISSSNKWNKPGGLICPSYRSFLEGVYSGKLYTLFEDQKTPIILGWFRTDFLPVSVFQFFPLNPTFQKQINESLSSN